MCICMCMVGAQVMDAQKQEQEEKVIMLKRAHKVCLDSNFMCLRHSQKLLFFIILREILWHTGIASVIKMDTLEALDSSFDGCSC